ncbi:hydroxypyruvate isomerase family protein [Arhodomonas sp. AD133]|uniref:hydroxypyruvate isomerase family protein n=1 Tax=Arhodomonas sp. AD133 TaxID=3415009 RepID=UPI003EBE424B
MLKFAANLTFLFREAPFLERFARARQCGFRYVEFHNPYPFCEDIDAISDAKDAQGVEIVHFNLPGGDWAAGERGIAGWPDRCETFRTGVSETVATARTLGCRQLNCPVGYLRDDFSPGEQHRCLVENLRWAAEHAAEAGITLLVEPLNPVTHPGYALTTTAQARALLAQVNHPNLKIQYDFFQMQRAEGDLIETVRANLAYVGFIQLADSPGRHEPGTGEVNYRFLLEALANLDFEGYVSLEYQPSGQTEASLEWMKAYGVRP